MRPDQPLFSALISSSGAETAKNILSRQQLAHNVTYLHLNCKSFFNILQFFFPNCNFYLLCSRSNTVRQARVGAFSRPEHILYVYYEKRRKKFPSFFQSEAMRFFLSFISLSILTFLFLIFICLYSSFLMYISLFFCRSLLFFIFARYYLGNAAIFLLILYSLLFFCLYISALCTNLYNMLNLAGFGYC